MCGLYIGATHIKCVLLKDIGTQFVLLELEVTRQPNIRLANHSLHSIQWTYHIMKLFSRAIQL